jgi:hypothetical protein
MHGSMAHACSRCYDQWLAIAPMIVLLFLRGDSASNKTVLSSVALACSCSFRCFLADLLQASNVAIVCNCSFRCFLADLLQAGKALHLHAWIHGAYMHSLMDSSNLERVSKQQNRSFLCSACLQFCSFRCFLADLLQTKQANARYIMMHRSMASTCMLKIEASFSLLTLS